MAYQSNDVEFYVSETEQITVPHGAAGYSCGGLNSLGVGFSTPRLGSRHSNDLREGPGMVLMTMGRNNGSDFIVTDEGFESTGFGSCVHEDGGPRSGMDKVDIIVHGAYRDFDEVNVIVNLDEGGF
jgi:hypothetical protein